MSNEAIQTHIIGIINDANQIKINFPRVFSIFHKKSRKYNFTPGTIQAFHNQKK